MPLYLPSEPIAQSVIVSTTPPNNPVINQTLWWNPDEQMQWFWNGTYWLSTILYSHNSPLLTLNSTSTSQVPFQFAGNYNLFLERFRVAGRLDAEISPGSSGIDSNINYWSFNLRSIIGGSSSFIIPGTEFSMQGRTYGGNFKNVFLTLHNINTHLIAAPNGNNPDNNNELGRGIAFGWNKFGSVPNMAITMFTAQCRFARP